MVEYGGGTATILFEGLMCTGTEDNLLECDHSKIESHNCFEVEKVGVSCGKLHIFGRYCMLYHTLSGL